MRLGSRRCQVSRVDTKLVLALVVEDGRQLVVPKQRLPYGTVREFVTTTGGDDPVAAPRCLPDPQPAAALVRTDSLTEALGQIEQVPH